MESTSEIDVGHSHHGLQVPITCIFLPEHTMEKSLQACRVCLLMDCRLYSMEQYNLTEMFKQLTDLQLLDDKYPSFLCAECATFLIKCKRFREKSLTVQKTLNVLSNTTCTVTIEQIKQVRKVNKLASNVSVKKYCPNYYDSEIYVVEDYEEQPPCVKVEEIKTGLTIDCEENFANEVNMKPHNFGTDIDVCEDDKEETPIYINGRQIKTEITSEREFMEAPSKLSLKKNQSHFSDIPFITYTYENYEENKVTTYKDNLLSTELFSDSDENDKIKTEPNPELVEVNFSKETNEKNPKIEFKKRQGSKSATKTAKKSVKKVFNCEQCDKVLKSKAVYLEHLRMEHHSTQHVCRLCGLSFINKRCLREHKNRKHVVDNSHIPDDGPCCPECSLHFLSEEALQTHLRGTLKDRHFSVKHSDSEFDEDLNADITDSTEKEQLLKSELESDGRQKVNIKKSSSKSKKKSVPKLTNRKHKSVKVPIDQKRIILKNMIVVKRLTLEEQLEVVQKRKENNQNKPYKCDICSFGTNLKKILETHMMRHSEKMGEFTCNLCHFRFKTSRAYHRHKRLHTYMYSCVECPFSTYIHHVASKHVMQFHEKQKYTCKCGNVYTSINCFYQHKKIKHPSSQHVCRLCGYSFVSKMGMKRHHNAKHLLESIEMPTLADGPSCAECSLRFMNEKALQTHMRVSHTTGTGKKMLNSSRVHVPDRKVVCETCGKLVKIYSLKSHLEEHAGKTFPCPICGETYGTKSGMYQHRYHIHVKGKDDKPFTKRRRRNVKNTDTQCKVCGKTFSTVGNCKRHMVRAHSGNVIRVNCSYCDKMFPLGDDLNQHVNHVHLKKPWYRKRAR